METRALIWSLLALFGAVVAAPGEHVGSTQELRALLDAVLGGGSNYTNSASGGVLIMPPSLSVDIVSLLRWVIQAESSNQKNPSLLQPKEPFFQPGAMKSSEHPIYNRSALNLVELGGKTYFFSGHQTMSWVEAMVYCRAYGMDLASLETAEKQNLIRQHIYSKADRMLNTYFISGNLIGDKKWRWLTGQEISKNDSHWAVGEPNDRSHPENCMRIDKSTGYLWHDLPCSYQQQESWGKQGFICELP